MNDGLFIWSVAIFAMLCSLFCIVIGGTVLLFAALLTLDATLTVLGGVVFCVGIAMFYGLYRWFTKDLEQNT